MSFSFDEVDSSWHPFFSKHLLIINAILDQITGESFTPERENVFRAFRQPVSEIRVVIFGQDPYPGESIADGLAFSSPADNPIPASLRNIFKEYASDLQVSPPNNPDLSMWSERGVLLLNRTLTTAVGERNAHVGLQWKVFTEATAALLGERDTVAILWGNYAKELSRYFTHSIESAHPSPLSAYRGFFGSKPFTRANLLLRSVDKPVIDWIL